MNRKLVVALSLLIPIFGLASCNASTPFSLSSQSAIEPSKLILLSSDSIEMEVSDTFQIKYSVSGEEKVLFHSEDETIATVSEKGLITAISMGETSIVLSLEGEVGAKASLEVEVKEKGPLAYGFYSIKEGVSDLSFLQGSPWLNTTVEGTMGKIEKPSLQDDFFAATNYESLSSATVPEGSNQEGGIASASMEKAEKNVEDLFKERKGEIDSLLPLVEKGCKTAIKSEIDNVLSASEAEIRALFSEASIFQMISRFLSVNHVSGKEEISLSFPTDYSYSGLPLFALTYGQSSKQSFLSGLLAIAEAEGVSRSDLSDILEDALDSLWDICGSVSSYSTTNEIATTVGDLNKAFDGVYDVRSALRKMGVSDSTKVVYHDFDLALAKKLDEWTVPSKISSLRHILAAGKILDNRFFIGAENYRELSKAVTCFGSITGSRPEFEEGATTLEICAAILMQTFPEVVNRAYIDAFITPSSREKVASLVKGIVSEYRLLFQQTSWWSPETMAKAIEKLNAMNCTVFYDDSYVSVSPFKVDEGDDISQAHKDYLGYCVTNIANGLFANGDLDAIPTYFVNAAYNPRVNNYRIFHGLVSSFIDDPDLTKEQLYGYVGISIGHEISHGFDGQGSQYDKNGRREDWWSEEDHATFLSKVEKVEEFYSTKLSSFDDIPMNGENTSGEVIADMGGMTVMNKLAEKEEDFDFATFYSSFAKFFGWVNPLTKAREFVERDAHPLGYLRVNLTLSQFDRFKQTFGIASGDGMYMGDEDTIAVW